jgi:glycosyltransferase involved in cell wall biosynthesis
MNNHPEKGDLAFMNPSWRGSLDGGDTQVSVNMIVRNEAPRMARVLSSLVPLCPAEVVVGDTGSTDGTADVARWFGCRVVDVPWHDHFADARNAVEKQSRQPFCLWIDGDEELADGSGRRLREKFMSREIVKDYHLIRFVEHPISMYQVRMWRRNPERPAWRGRVHEKVFMEGGKDQRHHDICIVQHHDERRPDKLERNMRLLKIAMAEEPSNHYNIFHAAILSNMMGDHGASEAYAVRYLAMAPRDDLKTKLYATYLRAWNAAFHRRDYQQAVNLVVSCLSVDPCAAELWCMLGDIYWWIGRKPDSLVFYRNAIELGKCQPETFWLMDLRKYDEYPREQIAKLHSMGVEEPRMPTPVFGPEVPA